MRSVAILSIFGALALAQEGTPISVPFSDPGRPKMVRASSMNGSITIIGYEGNTVQIETSGGGGERRQRVPRGAEGLRRLESGSSISAEEENNTVRISSSSQGNMTIKVPLQTSLKVQCTNGGNLKVERVSGDLELTNLNGDVTATAVSGSVIAHSLNGKVHVTIDRVESGKAMSFSTMNGDVDVTMPGDAKAMLRMKSDNGDVFTDFDINLTAAGTAPVVEDGRSKGGKYRVKVDKMTTGTINGGGPDLTFKTFNGNIYLRKKK